MSGYIKKPASEQICLSCREITAEDDRKIQTLNGIDLDLHKGEIVGVAGVEGNGQEELAQVLAGVRRFKAGSLQINAREMAGADSQSFIESSVAYIPSERNSVGTVPDFPLHQSWMLRNPTTPQKHGLIDRHVLQKQTAAAMTEFDVRADGIGARSANLSGGNLQKFILARELSKKPEILICSYPTRGLDVKASWFIRNRLTKAKEQGTGVLVFSSDLEELFAVSDRIVVLYRGKIVGDVKPEETSPQKVVLMMMGGKEHE